MSHFSFTVKKLGNHDVTRRLGVALIEDSPIALSRRPCPQDSTRPGDISGAAVA